VSIVVQKYGGTSVGDVDRMKRVADRVARSHRGGNQTVVVVSAMGKTTDDLVSMAARISERPPGARARHPAHLRRAHLDVAAGDGAGRAQGARQVVHRVAGRDHHRRGARQGPHRRHHAGPGEGSARRRQRRDRRRLPGRLAGHEGHHHARAGRVRHDRGRARRRARRRRLRDLHRRRRRVHRRPAHRPRRPQARLPSPTRRCSSSPRRAPSVLQVRSVEFGRNHGVRIHVRSSFSYSAGTWVGPQEDKVEDAIISGVAHDTSEAKLTVHGVPDTPGVAARSCSRRWPRATSTST
jgi:aspartate kinase